MWCASSGPFRRISSMLQSDQSTGWLSSACTRRPSLRALLPPAPCTALHLVVRTFLYPLPTLRFTTSLLSLSKCNPFRPHYSKAFFLFVLTRPFAGTGSSSSRKLRPALHGLRRLPEISNWICLALAPARRSLLLMIQPV